MGQQLDIKDVYPFAFPQTANNAELHEERQREARAGDGAAAIGINEHVLIGNQAWKVYGMLKNAMEHSDYKSAERCAYTLSLVLNDLNKQ